MATKYNGLFDYAANYNVQLAQPLDTRGVCDSVAALLAKDTFGTGGSFAYDGLTVVVPNAGVYYLKDKSKLTAKINADSYVDPVSATDEELLAAGWQKLGDQAASNVNSVNGKTGNVTLAAGDIGITAIEGVEGENIQAALEAINAKASTAYKYKGSKATYEELPAENNTVGDVWNVVAAHGTTPAGTNYAWTGDTWDALGGLVDLSTYQTKAITIDGEPTTVEAAITANKTSAANNTAAINKNKTDIEAVSGSVKGLDTLVKSKQDATVDVSVNSTSHTTIPEAIGALDAYVGEVKAVSDGAAKIDASNITDTGAWKNKLGYALESSLNAVATNVDTVSGNLKALSTKVDTISGDLDTLEVSVAAKASSTDLQAVSAQVDVNTAAIGTKATQADMTALSGKVEANTSAIAAANAAISGKADKANSLAGYGIQDAYTKTETDSAIDAKIATAIDGKVAKTDITTVIAESSAASDTKVPSEKAVASAIEEVKAVTSTTYKYKGSDTYENIAAKEDPAVGDVWNSTTANGVYPKGTNYAWNGEEWDALGGEVDLSTYQVKAITVGETPTTVEAAINANKTAIDAHVAKQDNPHNVTAAQVGLGNVNNTADADKPISTAQQAALDLKQDKTDNTLTTTSKTVVGAINEVKGVADAAAKADASNITVATWKEKLGFITASEVPEQVQPDWNAASGKGQILNKPDVTTASGITTIAGVKLKNQALVSGDNSITISSESAKIICKSESNITEFIVNNSYATKDVVAGSNVFSITNADESGKTFTLNASAVGVAEIIEL